MRSKIFFVLLAILAHAAPVLEQRPIFPGFVSGDAFRAYSDHVYDSFDQLLASAVKAGDTIFVQANLLASFFNKIHPRISHPYILISHNDDISVPGALKALLDDPKLIAWFGENYDGYPHPKMHPIPMGIANFNFPYGNVEAILKNRHAPKTHLVHMSFTLQTDFKLRRPLYVQFCNQSFVHLTGRMPFEDYLPHVAASKFALAPSGKAPDTWRLWECLYLGTIPIVTTSALDSLYEGLPILIIKDWKEITEDFLNQKYLELTNNPLLTQEKLTMEYWAKLIDSYKE